jgi:hypothetical protein
MKLAKTAVKLVPNPKAPLREHPPSHGSLASHACQKSEPAGVEPSATLRGYVTVPPNVNGQDEAGRLWDVVWMLRFAIRKAQPGQARLPFALYVRNDNRAPRLIKLIAMCGPLDMDAPEPAITVMMPDED